MICVSLLPTIGVHPSQLFLLFRRGRRDTSTIDIDDDNDGSDTKLLVISYYSRVEFKKIFFSFSRVFWS